MLVQNEQGFIIIKPPHPYKQGKSELSIIYSPQQACETVIICLVEAQKR